VVATALDAISLGRLLEFFQAIQALSLGSEGSAPLGEPPSILFGPFLKIAGQAEMLGRVESPERIEQHLAGEKDEVCATVLQIFSANSGVRIIPTAPVGIPASRRIWSANGTW